MSLCARDPNGIHGDKQTHLIANQIVFLLQNCSQHDTFLLTRVQMVTYENVVALVTDLKVVAHDESWNTTCPLTLHLNEITQ